MCTFRQYGDLLIVSPFAENQMFQVEYGENGTRFLEWKAPETFRQPIHSMIVICSLLRMQGYRRRYKNKGMKYLVADSYLKLGNDGDDKRISLLKRIIYFVISNIGIWSGAWRVIDRLIGPSIFNFPKLLEVAQNYEKVILIQSASWGIQDQMLAWMGRQQKWRKIMIPYTTDQLFGNGYLYSDFDAICVQGPFERWCAVQLHHIPEDRIVQIGSMWFRHIDEIKRQLIQSQPSRGTTKRRKILYVGSSRLYFPIASEYLGLERLMKAIEIDELTGVDIIYRPLGGSAEIKQEIQSRYENIPHLEIQFAQQACYGLDEYGGGSKRKELEEYVAQLGEADLVVMCGATTLALDAAYLGIASIANLFDPSGTLSRRQVHLNFNREGRIYCYESLPVIQSLEELVSCIRELLNDKEKTATIAHNTKAQWDYPETVFPHILIETLNRVARRGGI